MNAHRKLNELTAELKEEGIDVRLLVLPEGVQVIGPYRDRCLARATLKQKGVICAPVKVEDE